MQTTGIHHVTAIAGDPRRNVEFYTGLLGLRLVKRTVNFDDPYTYHLYYGDEAGRPGTILTFFPWGNRPRGRRGAGQTTAVAFSVPTGALAYWRRRLEDQGVPFEAPTGRFGEEVVVFDDPDGLRLELVAHDGADGRSYWSGGQIPAEQAVWGFHGVTVTVRDLGPTERVLVEGLGYRPSSREGSRTRYVAAGDGAGVFVDLQADPKSVEGAVAVGTVHHVAFRAADEIVQRELGERAAGLGLRVTPVMDRRYFRSIYFREPGGALFEVATDPPGFAVDETPETLGTGLMLPPWLEPMREDIERNLPPLGLPRAA